MANDVTINPIRLDTVSSGAIDSIRRFVKSVRWVGGTTAGHTATIKNGAGVVKWTTEAAGANTVEADLIEDWWEGLDMDVLGSGIIYVYIG